MQAFTPFVRVATDATRHFATFGLAPAAAFFIPNPARHPFQGWSEVGTPQGIVGLILNHLEIRSETIQKGAARMVTANTRSKSTEAYCQLRMDR